MHKETPKPIDDDNATLDEEPKGYSSPPCQRHEIDPAYGGELNRMMPKNNLTGFSTCILKRLTLIRKYIQDTLA